MPSIKIPTLEEVWQHVKSAPWIGECPADDGRHAWIYQAAKGCAAHWLPITPEQAEWLIRRDLTRPEQHPNEIRHSVANAYKRDYCGSGTATPRVEFKPYDPDMLAEVAARVPLEITDDWLAEVSPECVLDVTPATFLDAIFHPGECVWSGKHDADDGDIYHIGDTAAAANMVEYLKNFSKGGKYLINPVNGLEINGSIRSEPNLTDFRHLLIESDKAPRDLWLRMIVQVHAPILALYESGRRSIHVVIRLTATNKAEFLEQANYYRRQLIPLGADENAGNKPVQLSRLPGVVRHEAGKLQKLLYLAPNADGQPIYPRKNPANRYQRFTGQTMKHN
jgi:hypothetical protein